MNTITIELCAEDRARLDNIAELLGATGRIGDALVNLSDVLNQGARDTLTARCLDAVADGIRKMDAREPQDATTAPEPEAPKNDTPAPVEPAQETPAPAAEPVKVPTTEELQAIVQELAAPGSPKRAAVRDLVRSYAERVSLIHEDTRSEALQRLQELKEAKA